MSATNTRTSRKRRAVVYGARPVTIPGGHLKPTGVHRRSFKHFRRRKGYPHNLTPFQGDVLALISLRPFDLHAAAEALDVGEWSYVRHALDQLVTRELAEEIPGYPTTWRAT